VLPLFLVGAGSTGLQRELGFGPAKLGLIVSAFFAASAVAAVPLGHAIARIGDALGLMLAVGTIALSLTGIALLAGAWWHLALALACCGAANALVQVSSNTALARGVSRRRQGLAFGAKQAAIPLASVTAGLALPLVLLVAGWRAAFAGAAVVALAALAVLAVPPRRAAGLAAPAPFAADAQSFAPLGGVRATAHPAAAASPGRLLALLALTGLLAGLVASSIPAFAVDAAVAHGFGEHAAAALLALGSSIAVATRLGAGWVVDRRGSAGTAELAAYLLAGALAFCLLAAAGGAGRVLFAAGLLAAFATGWGWPGLLHYAAVRLRRDAPGVASGYVLSAVFLGNIAGPIAVGLVVEHRSYAVAWTLCAVVLALAALVATATAAAGRDRAAAAAAATRG
jgi:MFS family permease